MEGKGGMGRIRNLLLGGAGAATAAGDAGLLLLRLFGGLALALAHGIGKLPPTDRFIGMVDALGFVPAPLWATLSGIAEFGGGLLIAAGLLLRPAARLVLVNMLVAAVGQGAGDPFRQNVLARCAAASRLRPRPCGPVRGSGFPFAGRDRPLMASGSVRCATARVHAPGP